MAIQTLFLLLVPLQSLLLAVRILLKSLETLMPPLVL